MYEYDPSSFRGVFERDFGYLAGVTRNATGSPTSSRWTRPRASATWTYAELWRDVERLAGALGARGVRPGRRRSSSSSSTAPSSRCCWLGGACASARSRRRSTSASRPGETAHVIDDSRPAAFVFDAALGDRAREALALASHAPGLDRRGRRGLRRPARAPTPRRRRSPTATSTTRRPASTPRGRPACRRASRSTTRSR